jgi:hypothetical protein
MNQAYREILQQCRDCARQQGWELQREGAHLGWYTWKEEPWWKEMHAFILEMDVTHYPVTTWDWVDQGDIGIDYFNEYGLRHRPAHPIFKKYILYRLANERIKP